jgi:hypothetical protein
MLKEGKYQYSIDFFTHGLPINFDELMNITKKSYKESQSIELFLRYLLYKKELIEEIFVVTDNNIMKTFLDTFLLDIKKTKSNNGIKETKSNNYQDQNLWSIKMVLRSTLKLNPGNESYSKLEQNYESTYGAYGAKMLITRSAFSLANMASERGFFYKKNQIQDIDSPLSIYGIVSAIKFNLPGFEPNEKRDKMVVYVSPLIRTWMTAVCLYLKYTDNLTLVISPFIKETSGRFSYDNEPNNIDVQLKYFKIFLKLYIKINKLMDSNFSLDKKIVYIVYDNIYGGVVRSNLLTSVSSNEKKLNPKKNNMKKLDKWFSIDNINKIEVYSGFDKPTLQYINEQMSRWCDQRGSYTEGQNINIAIKKCQESLQKKGLII